MSEPSSSPLSPSNLSPLSFSSSPLTISLSPRINTESAVEAFFTERYGKSFSYENGETNAEDIYAKFGDHVYMYAFTTGGQRFFLKFSSDPLYSDLVTTEWNIYTRIYELVDEEHRGYFVQGVEGGIFSYEGTTFSYIIIPYIESISLARYTGKDVKEVLKGVVKAMRFLLGHDICHGDLHADNVLIQGTNPILIDFDSAGSCEEKSEIGYTKVKGRNVKRKNINFIGMPGNPTGLFVICRDSLSRYYPKDAEKVKEIIDVYLEAEDIGSAYTALQKLLEQKGGRKTRRKNRSRRLKKQIK